MSSSEALGGRLPLVDPKSFDPDQASLSEYIESSIVPWAKKGGFEATDSDGHAIGPFNPFLFSPLIARDFLRFVEAEQEHSSLSARVRQVIIVTVGAVWNSSYELYAHKAAAERAGLSPEVVQQLASGQIPEGLTASEAVAQRFTLQLCRLHRVDERLYVEAREHFGDRGLVDLVFLVGNYLVTCAVLNSFEVPAPAAH